MAGFLDEAAAFIFGTQAEWSLTHLDGEKTTITGQFRPTDLTEESSTLYAVSNVPMSTRPFIQWMGGNVRTFKFRAELWNKRSPQGALDSLGISIPDNPIIKSYYDVRKVLAALRKAMAPDPKLKRPPRWRFAYGEIGADVVISSLGGISYTEVWPDGRPKGITLEIELIEVTTPLAPKVTDFSIPAHKSRHRPTVQGGTYESMCKGEYRNPSVGILLRQDNTKAFPAPGEIVRLPELKYFRGSNLEPASYTLSASDAVETVVRELLETRGAVGEMPFVLR